MNIEYKELIKSILIIITGVSAGIVIGILLR